MTNRAGFITLQLMIAEKKRTWRDRVQPVLVFPDGIEIREVHGRGTRNYQGEDPNIPAAIAAGETIEQTHKRANIAIGRGFLRRP